ncbi:hypothetical protein [Alloalcanivorax xenomutans]|uniref:hypothetical protein n=1 Tax=Alloalcanivorax xenomutans TaxID=1094342 RepID=UPI002930D39C|nr:hypothetical protein [Alloalcanivorax xenomutans]WOA31782.1 hypothetical protein RVY87_01625 [Alloalcanivorax xenomutans]
MEAEQACSFLNTWVDLRYVFPAVLMLISSGLFPFLMHKYKLAREREEKLFDTRKEEYQGYFKKMEEAARLAGQDYDHFLTHTLPIASRKLQESNSSPEAVAEYQQTLHEFTKGLNEGYQKATSELVSLRIVCSIELAALLDEFEGTFQEMMNLQPRMLQEIRESMTLEAFQTGQFDFETPSKEEMTELGVKLVAVRNKIIATMRRELGYDS